MSIFYICGKPGGGKTYLGVKQICEELADSNASRYIVTNIELNFADRVEKVEKPLPFKWRKFGWFFKFFSPRPEPEFTEVVHKGLASWCHDNIKHEVNLRDRIRILNDQEAGEFWLYEPGRKFENRLSLKVGKHERDVPDFEDRVLRGCLYVIDECHTYFPAREWQLTGNDATFFLSQHRKLECDVVLITQHPEQCDKALRRLAQEYMTVRNLSREPFLGFNFASWFGEFRFLRMLNSPQSASPAIFESGFVSLNPKEIGALYNTMAGVGIAGRVVAKKPQVRGRSLWWLSVPLLVIIFAGFMLFTHIRQVNYFLSHAMQKAFYSAASSTAVSTNSILGMKIPSVPVSSPVSDDPSDFVRDSGQSSFQKTKIRDRPLGDSPSDTNSVTCSGIAILGRNEVLAFFSDGSTAYGNEGEIQKISGHWVWAFGKKYRLCGSPVRTVERRDAGDYPPESHVVDYGQNSSSELPVNDAEILPAIHSQASAILPSPRINGLASMSQSRQSESSGYQNSQ